MLPEPLEAATSRSASDDFIAASTESDFVRRYAEDPLLRADPRARAHHAALTSRASVCSYCGVGCSYTVQTDEKGVDRVSPLSPLGLCVKGATSLLTGGDNERPARLQRRGIADDPHPRTDAPRARWPHARGHLGAGARSRRVAVPARARVGLPGVRGHLWQWPEDPRSHLHGLDLQAGLSPAHRRRQLRALPRERGRRARAQLRQRGQLHLEGVRRAGLLRCGGAPRHQPAHHLSPGV